MMQEVLAFRRPASRRNHFYRVQRFLCADSSSDQRDTIYALKVLLPGLREPI